MQITYSLKFSLKKSFFFLNLINLPDQVLQALQQLHHPPSLEQKVWQVHLMENQVPILDYIYVSPPSPSDEQATTVSKCEFKYNCFSLSMLWPDNISDLSHNIHNYKRDAFLITIDNSRSIQRWLPVKCLTKKI